MPGKVYLLEAWEVYQEAYKYCGNAQIQVFSFYTSISRGTFHMNVKVVMWDKGAWMKMTAILR